MLRRAAVNNPPKAEPRFTLPCALLAQSPRVRDLFAVATLVRVRSRFLPLLGKRPGAHRSPLFAGRRNNMATYQSISPGGDPDNEAAETALQVSEDTLRGAGAISDENNTLCFADASCSRRKFRAPP